jgi:hypothetical protein
MSESVPETMRDSHTPPSKDFAYVAESGATITVPKFKRIPMGIVRQMRRESPIEQMFLILEKLASKETLAVIDVMGADEFNTFVEAWQADSGITAGESKASSSS